MMEKALVVDPDFLMRGYTVDSLQREGLAVIEAASAEEAIRLQDGQRFDIAFACLDILTAGSKRFKCNPDTILVVTTSFRTVDKAIDLIKYGAYDYIVKPFSTDQVSVVVARARELSKLSERIGTLEKEVELSFDKGEEWKPAFEQPTMEPPITNLDDLERQTIMRVLRETNGSRDMMAAKLGISVRTLRNKLARYRQEALLPD